MTAYDRWKTAYPPEWDEEESEDGGYDEDVAADLAYEADRDDRLTEVGDD
jgi:hypothetical protein